MKKTTIKLFLWKALLCFVILITSTANAFSQIKVSGTVTDSNNDQLIGVNITIKGSKTGTISDFEGNFSLQVADSKAVLVFSYIGFKTLEVPVGSTGVMKVVLEEDSKLIDEVVVVAYGTQMKSHLTGSVASLKNERLDEVPVSRIDQALQGKMAGVQINNTKQEAGESPVVRIRGMGSISASNEPLVVVDGFPVIDGLSMVSMADVESIEVLKDAASAALYGSRAAGGVILITTKQGNIEKPRYTFKMYSGIRTGLRLPERLDADKYVNLLAQEAQLRAMDPAVDGVNMKFDLTNDADRAGYLIQKYYLDQPTDWVAEALRKYGTMENYTLSASGGNKSVKYFISGNYSVEDGIMRKSSYDRYNFRARLDVNLSKKISFGINISPTYSQTERPAANLNDYMRFPSWLPIRHNQATAALTGRVAGEYAQPTDFIGFSLSGIGINEELWHVTGVNVSGSAVMSPVSKLERISDIQDEYRMQNNAYLTINFTPELQFKTSNGAFASYRERNQKAQTSANRAGEPNSLNRQTTLRTNWLSENTLNFQKKTGDHDLGVLLGFTAEKSTSRYNRIIATNFPDELMLSLNLASQILLDAPGASGTTSFYYTESMMSFLGRVTYALKDKYLFSGSFRSDGSSKFAEGHRWGTFPSASAGWRLSEEGFMKSYDWLSNLKIRASVGLTGNNNIPQYAYMNTINTSNYVFGGGTGTLTPGMSANSDVLGNNEITWEQTQEANFGIDLGLLNNKYNLSVEYYNSNTIQLLLQQPAMFITGHQNYWNNIGKVNNQGIEIELKTTLFDAKKFKWDITGNLSTNKNTLLSYGGKEYEDNFGERNEVYRAIVGQPSIQYFGYKSDGVYTTFQEVAAALALTDENGVPFNYTKYVPKVGGLKVVNTNGDNAINPDDRIVLGDPFPDFTWGITNNFKYKDFDLSFLFQGVQGVTIINGNIHYNEQLRSNARYLENRYVSPNFPGDGKTVYSNTTAGGDLILSDYALEDGSYASLRDISLGYTIPRRTVRKLGIRSVRGYFSGQNLIYFMASDYRGINPEARFNSGYSSPLKDGYQRGAFPLHRTFTVGVDIAF